MLLKKHRHLSTDAPIGYRIRKGDWIVNDMPRVGKKYYTVCKVTPSRAFVLSYGREYLKFPRYYTLNFEPLDRKRSKYRTFGKWYVKVNEHNLWKKWRKIGSATRPKRTVVANERKYTFAKE